MKSNTSSRRFLRQILAGSFLLLCIGLPAYAADCSRLKERVAQIESEIPDRFAKADTNNDGRITREELAAAYPKLVKHFDRSRKATEQGYFTLAQAKAAAKEHGAARIKACETRGAG
jgi:EF hand